MALSNRDLAELLARAGEEEDRGTNRHRALVRASRAAFAQWPEEASDLLAAGRSLTELRAVGPWVAGIMAQWFERAEDLEPVEPAPLRQGFLTLAEVRTTLAEHPEWVEGLRGDLQMHTTYSDGSASVREMAEECSRAYGYQFVAITDHSKGLPIANGMDEARLAGQAEEIRTVRAELRGRPTILHGLEMNLSPEGEGDMDRQALRSLDLVLGAFHSKLRTTEDQTKRYVAALRNPDVHVLAHPRGRRWGARLGLQADWPAVFEEAVAQNTALEVDAFPDRQDLDVDLLRLAREAGAWISMGTDAHRVRELAYREFGIAAAIKAGIRRERILNFLPLDDLRAWSLDRT